MSATTLPTANADRAFAEQQRDTDSATDQPELTDLALSVSEYVRAAFGGLVIETDEPDDAIDSLTALCREQQWQLASWNLASGLTGTGDQAGEYTGDPAGVLTTLDEADGHIPLLLVLRGYHRFLASPEIVARLERCLLTGKLQRTCLILLVPAGGIELPAELRPLLVTLQHQRPDDSELAAIVRGVATGPDELAESNVAGVLNAARGMTRGEAESACALSLVRYGRVLPAPLWELKTQAVQASGLMTLSRDSSDFDELRGLTALKDFCRQSLLGQAGSNGSADARGVLLLSPPGCGKSQFARALGSETGRPVLSLDVGRLLGSLVGESERNLRRALSLAEAMSPCILLLDEVEKMISTGGERDSGVGSRLLGTLLTWMQDRTTGVYIVMTSNDARRLPPELTRAERLDATFFVDLPDAHTRSDIWRLYREFYALDTETELPDDTCWTGAEIRACCRLAGLLGVSLTEAAAFVVPIQTTCETQINRLRHWASGRTLDAHAGGLFRARGLTAGDSDRRRRVTPRPSDN